jgi:hypothetical protein
MKFAILKRMHLQHLLQHLPDREIAPQTIFSQNTRFRPCTTPPPPPLNFDIACRVGTIFGFISIEASTESVEESQLWLLIRLWVGNCFADALFGGLEEHFDI